MSTPFTPDHLARRCRIAAVVIRSDGMVCTFYTSSWLDFCRQVVETADGIWAADRGVGRVFGCDRRRGLLGRWLPVADFAAASRACREFIAAHDLGASRWRGGRVIDAATKRIVATVSYNGRVWLPDGSALSSPSTAPTRHAPPRTGTN